MNNLSQEDARSLVEELSVVKETLREVSRLLLRIERRVRVAIPNAGDRGILRSRDSRRLDEQTARQLIERLKESIAKGEQVETQLRAYSVKPDLQTFAKILGMTNTKLPPKDELVRRISSRLRQSVSVTAGIQQDIEGKKNE